MVERFLVKMITSQGPSAYNKIVTYVGADQTGYTITPWKAHRFESYNNALVYIQANIEIMKVKGIKIATATSLERMPEMLNKYYYNTTFRIEKVFV